MQRPEVFIERTGNRREFVKAVLERVFPELKNERVFVKPNIVSFEPYPTTTHPDVLREVLRFFQKRKCEVGVGDGPAPDAGNSERIIENHPLQRVCGEFDLELLDLHKEGFYRAETKSGFTLRISRIVQDFRKFVSLPVLKAHPGTGLTGALKNQFGFLHNRERIMMHARLKDIHRGTAELNTLIKPDLFIMDAVESYKTANEARHGGIKVELGYMLAGQDAVALDSFGLELLERVEPSLKGKKPLDIRHLALAAELGAGLMDYRESKLF